MTMLKKISFFVALLCLISCNTSDKIERTAKDYLEKNVALPGGVTIEQIDVLEDTIPFYLNDELLKSALAASEKQNAIELFRNQLEEEGEAFRDINERVLADVTKEYETAKERVVDMINKLPDSGVANIVLVRYSGKNLIGDEVRAKKILIVDKEDLNEVKGSYSIDPQLNYDFIQSIIYLLSLKSKEVKFNQFGKVVADNLPAIEKFILEDYEKPKL